MSGILCYNILCIFSRSPEAPFFGAKRKEDRQNKTDRRKGDNAMLTDIEIAQQAKMLKIGQIAEKLGITEDELELTDTIRRRYRSHASTE